MVIAGSVKLLDRGKTNHALNNCPAITCRLPMRVKPDSSDPG